MQNFGESGKNPSGNRQLGGNEAGNGENGELEWSKA